MIPPIKVSCDDHSGSGLVRFQQWDGKQWKSVSDWISGDSALVRKMVEESAAQYAEGEGYYAGVHEGLRRERPAWPFTARRILVVNNVEVIYDHVILVLKGVSLEVPQGSIVALLGANGAGKTTTLKAISNLLASERGEVTKGSIEFKGERVDQLNPSELVRRGVIQVMEGRHCFQHLTVEENLLTGAFTRSGGRAEIRRDLEMVYGYFPRLQERRRSQAGYTSGGEQQMTAIGRALMARPTMILLDEPSMGLAPQVVEEIFDIVRTLNEKEGVSFLLAEQNTAVALRYADYGYILENGRVVMDGPGQELGSNEDVKEFYLGLSAAAARASAMPSTIGAASAGWLNSDLNRRDAENAENGNPEIPEPRLGVEQQEPREPSIARRTQRSFDPRSLPVARLGSASLGTLAVQPWPFSALSASLRLVRLRRPRWGRWFGGSNEHEQILRRPGNTRSRGARARIVQGAARSSSAMRRRTPPTSPSC